MTTIGQAVFVGVDTETTGLDPTTDTIIEVAAGVIGPDGGISHLRFESFVNPERPIPATVSGVTNLVDSDLCNAPTRAAVVESLRARVRTWTDREVVFVAHNAEFDRAMLPELDHRWLCTKRLAQHLVPDAPDYKLATLKYHLFGAAARSIHTWGLDAHRAIADVAVTAAVFRRLLLRYAATDAFVDDIDALIEYVQKPVLFTSFPFGKHRGEPLASIPEDYLRWMLRQNDFDADVRHTAQTELTRRAEVAA